MDDIASARGFLDKVEQARLRREAVLGKHTTAKDPEAISVAGGENAYERDRLRSAMRAISPGLAEIPENPASRAEMETAARGRSRRPVFWVAAGALLAAASVAFAILPGPTSTGPKLSETADLPVSAATPPATTVTMAGLPTADIAADMTPAQPAALDMAVMLAQPAAQPMPEASDLALLFDTSPPAQHYALSQPRVVASLANTAELTRRLETSDLLATLTGRDLVSEPEFVIRQQPTGPEQLAIADLGMAVDRVPPPLHYVAPQPVVMASLPGQFRLFVPFDMATSRGADTSGAAAASGTSATLRSGLDNQPFDKAAASDLIRKSGVALIADKSLAPRPDSDVTEITAAHFMPGSDMRSGPATLTLAAAVQTPKIDVLPPADPKPADAGRISAALFAPALVDKDQIAAYHSLLLETGYSVAEPKSVGFAISSDQVRFFYPADAAAARALAEAIGARVRDFTDFRPLPEEGTVEIWMSGKSGKATTSKPRNRAPSQLDIVRQRILSQLRGSGQF